MTDLPDAGYSKQEARPGSLLVIIGIVFSSSMENRAVLDQRGTMESSSVKTYMTMAASAKARANQARQSLCSFLAARCWCLCLVIYFAPSCSRRGRTQGCLELGFVLSYCFLPSVLTFARLSTPK
jgi:hypothetical protein